ncbi:helix-turn-helix transcriptional regulator [Rhizobium chutanense]|nr:AraC family transcriptional regulator [Rhizobium chutanense]
MENLGDLLRFIMSNRFLGHAKNSLVRNPASPSEPVKGAARSGVCPDELSEMLSTPKSLMKVTVESDAPIGYSCRLAFAEGIEVADCSYRGALTLRREAPSDRMLVVLPRHGGAVFDYVGKPIESVPGHATILECELTAGLRVSGPRHHLGLFIDKTIFTRHLTQMFDRTVTGTVDFFPQIDLSTGPGLALMHVAENLHSGLQESGFLRQSPLALAALRDALTCLLLENFPHRYSDEPVHSIPLPAPRHVKRAIDFMHAHYAEPISLDDLAVAARVSSRTLQEGFRQFRSTTPMSYLKEIRLVAVHRELLEGDYKRSVASVALKWGFTHVGRFASEYRKRFGQLPSETLKH